MTRAMKNIVAATLAATVALAAPADAHYSATSRVHNARHVSEAVYGPGLCDVGTMNVPIVRRPNGIYNRAGQLTGFAGLFNYHHRPEGGYTRCLIEIDGRESMSTAFVCSLIGHEMGHAAGLDHSPDPMNIMYAYGLPFWSPCAMRRNQASP